MVESSTAKKPIKLTEYHRVQESFNSCVGLKTRSHSISKRGNQDNSFDGDGGPHSLPKIAPNNWQGGGLVDRWQKNEASS